VIRRVIFWFYIYVERGADKSTSSYILFWREITVSIWQTGHEVFLPGL